MKYPTLREEELKNKVAHDFFGQFDCTEIIRDIDFAVKSSPLQVGEGLGVRKIPPSPVWRGEGGEEGYLLWAEAKAAPSDIFAMLTQLLLTIGKARTFDKVLPPPFLGCFDCEKIAFVPYAEVQDIFYQNDFNWNVTPSNRETREFKMVYAQIKKVIDNDVPWNTYLFNFEKDEKELKRFIRENLSNKGIHSLVSKTRIDKNNFIIIYNKWLETVKSTIAVDWDTAKKNGIIDGDFYLADLLSRENETLKEKLFVLLKTDYYELDRIIDSSGFFISKKAQFKDNQKAHNQFWAKYERPPLEEYWEYIIERRDLLVPQDVRERKGSFFTPRIWVELSQKYLADMLGEDWQDEYYVWDCAAGTGNLLAGLTNKYKIWASTLDKADVDVMKERIHNGANLLESHVFQFDFLNDDFTKLPKGLQEIINDPKRRKKLVIYINPPYAEATNKKAKGENRKDGVAKDKSGDLIKKALGGASNELFAHFMARVYKDINGCYLAQFSKLKFLSSHNFKLFRSWFFVEFKSGFIVRANTFDNVTGNFPIGFTIWQIGDSLSFPNYIELDVVEEGSWKRTFWSNNDFLINNWIKKYNTQKEYDVCIGKLNYVGNDFQQNERVWISINLSTSHILTLNLNKATIIPAAIYFAVRLCIKQDWLNDRDQFLHPNDGWKTDTEFQNDCLAFILFHGQNKISSRHGTNHWIPFTEYVVGARDNFDSNFMTSFIEGIDERGSMVGEPTLFYGQENGDGGGGISYEPQLREFSETARNVFSAGRKLWKYYHNQPKCNVNASLYDIREHFQGRNEKGNMNNKSDDETYNELIANLRSALKILAEKIEPKVYEYGFLRE